jgi:hypothetical protein
MSACVLYTSVKLLQGLFWLPSREYGLQSIVQVVEDSLVVFLQLFGSWGHAQVFDDDLLHTRVRLEIDPGPRQVDGVASPIQ